MFMSLKIVFISSNFVDPDEMPPYAAFHLSLHCLPKKLLPVARMKRVMDKAPKIAHLSILTSVGYNKKETK